MGLFSSVFSGGGFIGGVVKGAAESISNSVINTVDPNSHLTAFFEESVTDVVKATPVKITSDAIHSYVEGLESKKEAEADEAFLAELHEQEKEGQKLGKATTKSVLAGKHISKTTPGSH